MLRLVIVFAATLYLALFMSPAASDAKTPDVSKQFERYGNGLLLSTDGSASFIADGKYYTIYSSPDKTSEIVGYLEKKSQPDTIGLHHYSYQDPNFPPIEADFLDRLLGKETIIQWQYRAIHDVQINDMQFGVVIYDRKPGWVRIDAGWIEYTPEFRTIAQYKSWCDIMGITNAKQALSNWYRVPEKNEIVALGTLDQMRRHTLYSPVLAVNIYSSPVFGRPTTTVSEPLQLTVLEQKGEWLRVFAIISECQNAVGKTDFREGTIGWVSLIGPNGAPQIRVAEKKCEEL